MLRCPDCGRVIATVFPMHVCEPTADWRKGNPGVKFIVKSSGGPRYGGGYLTGRGRGFKLTGIQKQAIRFASRYAAEIAAEKFDPVSPPPVLRLRKKGKKRRCTIIDCPQKVVVILTYVDRASGDKGGGPYCFEHAESKMKLFKTKAKGGKVEIDRSPQRVWR